jgi:hypothetical protein
MPALPGMTAFLEEINLEIGSHYFGLDSLKGRLFHKSWISIMLFLYLRGCAMKRSLLVLAVLVCFVLTFGAFSIAKADTLLFPVIAINQPNVTTIVSITNEDDTSSPSYLHYIYRVKDSLVGGLPNITGTCTSIQFTRPSYYHDLVSFDASGSLDSGNALFGDTDTYGGSFSMGLTGPRRAYLLVTHSNSSGTRVNVGNNTRLFGEAIVMDIMFGAAWGYKAINDTEREDYTFTDTGVQNSIKFVAYNYRGFTFFPPNEWTTKFFVTPIGADMNTSNLEGQVRLSQLLHVVNRTGIEYTFTPPDIYPKCTAAIDLNDMMDSTTLSAVDATGGFSRFCVQSTVPVIAYKLEYVVNNPTYGGTNNNCYLLTTTRDMP